MMAGRLEKLKIKNMDNNEEISVLFNPSEYTIEDASRWAEQKNMGKKPELHYTGGERRKLSMELFFDTYEQNIDVRTYTNEISKLLGASVIEKEKHRPPKLQLIWGSPAPGGKYSDFPFTCVMTSLRQQFILFMGDGTPVRAKLLVTFLEFSLPEEEQKKNEQYSADHTKTYIVKVGDTASSIAGMFYDDPRKWRHIAKENNIENPRMLEPGSLLAIPRIE